MHLFLIGYRGTGKTTVARQLGEQLAQTWVDADEEIERLAGNSIATIFAEQGEEAFRDLETTTIENLCQRSNQIVALGGGAVLRETNRELIRRAGKSVWLTASVETILARISADSTTADRRPNLSKSGGRQEIEQLLTLREPIYRQMADWIVDTENKTPAEIAAEILSQREWPSP